MNDQTPAQEGQNVTQAMRRVRLESNTSRPATGIE